jgi:D-sedoheptulose 7-phosphate isomerase
MSVENYLTNSLSKSISCKQDFWNQHRKQFFDVAQILAECVSLKNKVLIFGNGGSACDALHFAGEWVNRFSTDRAPLACLALTADAPLITCIANDYSFDKIFERQILALGRTGDVAIGISTSGNSKNVIAGLNAAKQMGMKSLALLGGNGGEILKLSHLDASLLVSSSTHTPHIQETHSWILHSLCDYIEIETLKLRKA